MEAGVFEIFGTRYYTHGFGLLLVAPFALWFAASLLRTLYRLLRKRRPAVGWGLYLSALLTMVSFVVAFWDVYQIGQQATKLCKEQGGLHVYKTVEAEGFIGSGGIEYWANYGFKYVEDTYANGKKVRGIIKNGKATKIQVDSFLSEYEYSHKREKLGERLVRGRYCIVHRQSGDCLGELIVFGIHGGWADMLFYNLTGFSYTPWGCGDKNNGADLTYGDVVKATLKPVSETK